jgi:hypothetical protein
MQKKETKKGRIKRIQERAKSQPEVPDANHLTCTRSKHNHAPRSTAPNDMHTASSIMQWPKPVA